MAQAINDRLIVEFEAKIDKLQAGLDKAVQATGSATGKINKHLGAVNDNFKGLFGKVDPGKALDKVFDSSRLRILEEGGLRLRVFGSALEPLGPLGIIAAAGIAAFGLALDRAGHAAEFAASLEKTSKELGTTTGFLQEFAFAAKSADIPIDSANASLKEFDLTIGRVKDNLARKQVLQAFADIGISKQQIQSVRDVGAAFDLVATNIGKAGDASQQAAVLAKIGLGDLTNLVKGGPEGFKALADQAQHLGIVMDDSLVAQGAEAHKKLEQLDEVMKDKTNIAFVQFAGTLVTIKQAFLDATVAGLDFLAKVTNTQSIDQKIQSERDAIAALKNTPYVSPDDRAFAEHERNIRGLELAKSLQALAYPAAPATPATKDHPTIGGTKPVDRSATVLDDAIKAELDARRALTGNIQKQADIEAEILQAEGQKKLDELAQQLKRKEITKKAYDEAKVLDQKALAERLELLDRQTAQKLADQELAYRKEIDGYYSEIAKITASMADTLAERRRIEEQALLRDQADQRAQLKNDLSKRVQSGEINQNQADATLASQGDLFAAQRKQLSFNNAGPIDQFLRSLKDLDTTIQGQAVSAFQSLSSGLADAIVNAKNLGDVAKSVFRQILSDIIQNLIEQNLANPLTKLFSSAIAAVPFFADGTNSAPGGLAVVGERGPELVNLSRGAQVFPNQTLASLRSGGAAMTVNLHQTIDLRGANGDATIARIATQAATHAAIAAFSAAKREIPRDLARSAGRRLG